MTTATATADGLLPTPDGPVATAVAALLSGERRAAGPRPTAMGTPLRGSMAGKCSRAIGLEIAGQEPDLELETSTLFAFDVGQGVHDIIQRALVSEFDAEIEVPVTWEPGLALSCNVDAYLPAAKFKKRTAVEIKSMKAYAFDLATGTRRRGELPGPKAEHLLQSGLGGLAPALDAEQLLLIYASKEDGRLAEWWIGVDEPLPHLGGTTVREMVNNELVRMRGILARLAAGTLPRPVVPGHGLVTLPPARGTKGDPWQCRYCPWQPTCARLGPELVPLSALTDTETHTPEGSTDGTC